MIHSIGQQLEKFNQLKIKDHVDLAGPLEPTQHLNQPMQLLMVNYILSQSKNLSTVQETMEIMDVGEVGITTLTDTLRTNKVLLRLENILM